ncbi:hypothetical protein Q1695_013240 [Nippostrongylus brasiliensis]|nr:hypothetical protein Q1695_013240 [Nippostrongylus brasiliensis]
MFSEEDSLQSAAESVAKEVLDSVSCAVENSLRAYDEQNSANLDEDKEKVVQRIDEQTPKTEDESLTSDEYILEESEVAIAVDDALRNPPSEGSPGISNVSDESVVTSSYSCSNASVVTVIHRPSLPKVEVVETAEQPPEPQQDAAVKEDPRKEPEKEPILGKEEPPSHQENSNCDVVTAVSEKSDDLEPDRPTLPAVSEEFTPKEEVEEAAGPPLESQPSEILLEEQFSTIEVCDPDTVPNRPETIRIESGPTTGEPEISEESTQKSDSASDPIEVDTSLNLETVEQSRSERAGSEESCHGLETAIECETRGDDLPSPAAPRDRFGAQVISTIHDLSQDSDPMRLTESELQLGKSKPYWIPDDDCPLCMLCNARFSLLNRRHHCRACGRVACGACCKERAQLQYLKDEPKKQAQARVCTPCASMLARIEDYEKMMREHAEGSGADEPLASTSSGARAARGVLKTRTASVSEQEAESSQSQESAEKKRSVVFRDGVKPGAASPSGPVEVGSEERSTTVKPKKKSRKRHSVARRVAELRMEDELACALPTAERPRVMVVAPTGEITMVEEDWITNRLKEDLPVTVVLKRNLSCMVKVCKVGATSVFCVHSNGFATIGLDEVLFVWNRENLDDFALPLTVLYRIAQIYSTSCDSDQAGVRQVSSRLPAIHSVPIASPPLTRHILFFPPTLQDFSTLMVPKSPFLIALFLNDVELPWAMACPNRLLFRLGLKYSWYPTPIVNIIGRDAVYSMETSQTVLKVFTDFRSWSFRMKHISGCTVTLNNEVTLVEMPKSAKDDLKEIISLNRKMLAWTTCVNLAADSHLVCEETDGVYYTQVLARGATRKFTGASFLIIDGGLKTNGLQINVVEDGVAIRIPSDKLDSLLQALESCENWVTADGSGTQFIVRWTDGSSQTTSFGPVSAIDGQCLANKFQYGLSLERAISSVLQVNSVSDYGVRLSHVYNLKDGRLAPDDEPKVFSVAEMLARECSGMLEPYLSMLINMNIMSISIRVGVSSESVEYDVSPWFGMEEEQMLYKQNMDQLIPVLYDILGYLSGGFHIELTLSFVSTKCLPYVM